MSLPHTIDFDLSIILCPNCNDDNGNNHNIVGSKNPFKIIGKNIKNGMRSTRAVVTESLSRIAMVGNMIPGLG